MSDILRLTMALAPLGGYAVLVGAINLRQRPFLTSLARDTAALGVAMGGMILIGPMELLAPEASFEKFGWFTWLLLGSLYGLSVSLYTLLQRPGLVLYNISLDEFRPVLLKTIQALERDASWAGNTVSLPSLGVEMHVECTPLLRNICLTSVGDEQSLRGWRRLELALEPAVAELEVRPSHSGVALVSLGALVLGLLLFGLGRNHDALSQAFRDFLRQP